MSYQPTVLDMKKKKATFHVIFKIKLDKYNLYYFLLYCNDISQSTSKNRIILTKFQPSQITNHHI
jgi:hypothetical protein